MSVLFSPIFNSQVVDDAGDPATGWKVYAYAAGSSTPQDTYTTSAGTVAQSNPIVINSLGFPTTGQIWLTAGLTYKLVLTDENDVVQKTEDNISGVNDVSTTADQWVASGLTPTYISATSFSLVGDQTTAFHVGRRLKTTNSGGTVYSTIVTSAYGAVTTVTVVNDSGTLDAGLSAVSYGLLTATNPSTPLLADTYPIVSGSSDKTKKLRFEVDGLTTGTTRVVTMPDTDINLVYSQQATTSLAGAGEWAVQSEMDAGTASKVATTDLNKISLGTEQATTSGTTKDFTGIPAGVRRITVHFRGVSTNGTSNIIIQLGDSGGIENSGYVGGANNSSGGTVAANSAGFVVMVGVVAAKDASGHITLVLEDSSDFTWTQTGLLVSSDALAATLSAGYKSLSAELTQLRITMANGTDAFDAGAINISYER